jgi:hypothetical protein
MRRYNAWSVLDSGLWRVEVEMQSGDVIEIEAARVERVDERRDANRAGPQAAEADALRRAHARLRVPMRPCDDEAARRGLAARRYHRAIVRVLNRHGLRTKAIWAGEHDYLIYNRRFAEMQAIGVYAAEVDDALVRLDPSEHSELAWLSCENCLDRVHYRGLKDGLRSVHEYVTGVAEPAKELCLYVVPGG